MNETKIFKPITENLILVQSTSQDDAGNICQNNIICEVSKFANSQAFIENNQIMIGMPAQSPVLWKTRTSDETLSKQYGIPMFSTKFLNDIRRLELRKCTPLAAFFWGNDSHHITKIQHTVTGETFSIGQQLQGETIVGFRIDSDNVYILRDSKSTTRQLPTAFNTAEVTSK